VNAAADRQLLDGSIARLRETGVIEYGGEFGAEITTFIPFVHWLKSRGMLSGRRVLTYAGMRPYYYFLDDAEYAEKPGRRAWVPVEQRIWPSNSSYTATRQEWHRMPDYRARFAGEGMAFERPVLFVQNKFCVEWGEGPINYLPLKALERLFTLAGDRFDVVYSRPRALERRGAYAADDNSDCDYPDLALARRFPAVLVLEDHVVANGLDYNLTKLQIAAKAHLFVAVQGGGAHLLACFGDSLLLLLHRVGDEYPHCYAAGPYTYLADPPPLLLVARDTAPLMRGIELVADARLVERRLQLPTHWRPLIAELSVPHGG
jgi:hypothetical protein